MGWEVSACQLRLGKKALADSHLRSSTHSSFSLTLKKSRPGDYFRHHWFLLVFIRKESWLDVKKPQIRKIEGLKKLNKKNYFIHLHPFITSTLFHLSPPGTHTHLLLLMLSFTPHPPSFSMVDSENRAVSFSAQFQAPIFMSGTL